MAGKGKRYGGCIVWKKPGVAELRLYLGSVVETLPDGTKKRKKKYYTETFYGNGEEAAIRMANIVSDRAKGQIVDPDKITVREYLEVWFESAADSRQWSDNTKRIRQESINKINGEIGDVPLQKLGALDIQKAYGRIRKTLQSKGRRGDSSISLVHSVMTDAMARAVALKLIGVNPMEGVKSPKYVPDKREVWTEEQQELFKEKAVGYRYYPVWMLMLNTSMRIGEATALRWSDIDMDKRTVSIKRTGLRRGGTLIEGKTKTYKGNRLVPFSEETQRVLAHWKVQQNQERLLAGPGWEDKTNRVFTTAEGRPLNYNAVRQSLMTVCAKLGLPYDGQHNFRHACGTNLARSGVDAKTASEIMGHTDPGFFYKYYVAVTEESKRDAIEQVERYVERKTADRIVME